MRLLALDLLRYGHLTDLRLRFPEDAGLHVVLGANEAGKSTALAAVGDALFGFPHLTPYAFLHRTDELRIGFEVLGRDGARLALQRRKGRKDTLLDAAEAPVPEAALARFLGGAGRELFETAFGLNGQTLRRGGQSLIEGGGAAGEAIIAGMGLPHLRKALDRIDRQAGELHGTRHGKRRLADAAQRWEAAKRAMEDNAVRPAEWTEAEAALERAEAELAALATEDAALRVEELRLRRGRAVAPLLAQLAALRAEFAPLADAPALPADAAATLARLGAALGKAGEDAARDAAMVARLEAERAALPRDAAALAASAALDRLAEARVTALAAARDLPEVRRKAAAHRDRVAAEAARVTGLAEAARATGPADAARVTGPADAEAQPSADAARQALPRPAAREAAQRLLRGRTALHARLGAAEDSLRAATRRHERATAALAASAAPAGLAPLKRALEEARGEGPLDRDLARAEAERDAAARRADQALAVLDLWRGDAAALRACRLPLPALAEDAACRMEAARGALQDARRAAAETAATILALDQDLAHLSRGEEVPTRDRIAEARARRDAAWVALRRALEAGTMPEPPGLPDAFEDLAAAADRLADARADDAQRVNDYAAKSARRAVLRDQHAAALAGVAQAVAAALAAEAAWAGLWAPAGLLPAAPAAMRQWVEARAKVIELLDQAETLARRRDEIAARRDAACAALRALLPAPPAGAALAPLIAAAAEACTAAEAASAAHQKLRDAATKAAEEEAAARDAAETAAAALASGAEGWGRALAELGLAPDAAVEEVETALAAWGAIAEAATAWAADEARVAEMRAALDGFGAQAASLAAQLDDARDGEAPAVTAARLLARLEAARAAEATHAALGARIAEHQAAMQAARDAAARAEAELARLHEAAGTADRAALEAAVAQAARREELRADIARQEAALLAQGDGLDEAALRAEAAGFDPDGAAARLDAIALRRAGIADRRPALGGEREAARARLASLSAGRDAAGFAQDAQQALAEAEDAAARYARLHLARTLLKAGIERLRQDRQGPMLRAAAAHFALLTGGRYARLSIDEDEQGRPLLRALRADGTACPMEALSEGTRDQLYLALRVAALETHAEGTEPLPFIADDLLASFDDERAAAALALLRRLGPAVQVILFTHHAHVASLAARQEGVAVHRLAA